VQAIKTSPERLLLPEDIDYTSELSVTAFADGEMEVTLHRSVRNRNVFLFANSSRNESGLSVETCKIELYHTIDALKRSQAREIIVFEPYISCSRSDRTTRRNSVGLWVHYKTLVSLGMNHLVTYQLHSDKSKTVFDPCLCSIDDVPAVSLLQRYLCDTTIRNLDTLESTVRDDWLFCSVDAGGEKLARRFAQAFGTQLVVAHKQRSYIKANTVESVSLLSAVPLEDKVVWIVDDMIDTAGSVLGLLQEMAGRSCREINVMIVHPVLSDPAVSRLAELKQKGFLGRLVVCDTISCSEITEKLPFIEIISSADLCARIVLTIALDRAMADIIDTFNPREYLA
jgi:ribose-phosphate pyrophosphokinase